MGVITKLHVGRDSFVHSVNLKTCSGDILRPIAKLYPLEVYSDDFIREITI